jgi:endoglucanase
MATRRTVLKGLAATLASGTSLNSVALSTAATPVTSEITVHEITMAAPDVVCVEVRDGAITHNGIVMQENTAKFDGFSDIPGIGWAAGIGPVNALHDNATTKPALRLADLPPQAYLNRVAADDALSYGKIGGKSVVSVYRKTVPYDSGHYRSEKGYSRAVAMKHFLYLQLTGALAFGQHQITPPQGSFPSVVFDFNQDTRCIAIRNTQHGMRAADTLKLGYLSLWLPGAAQEGAVDFVKTYGLKKFEVIDAAGQVQFTGDITLRLSPDQGEVGSGLKDGLMRYASLSKPPLKLVAVDYGTPARLTYEGDDPYTGDVLFPAHTGIGKLDNTPVTVDAVDVGGKTVTLKDVNLNGQPAYGGGGVLYASHQSNRAGTFIFGLDYGAWVPAQPGSYRLRIPTLGVSDPFVISEASWFASAQKSIAALYAHRSGIEIDGRFGYKRPANFRREKNGQVIYKSYFPIIFSTEGGGSKGFNTGAIDPWVTAEEIDLWGGYHDAGDWDRRVIPTYNVVCTMLDVYELLPEKVRNVSFGLPKSSEILDPKLYAGTDSLPDIVHEAIWAIDMWRRCQDETGAVHGGIESNGSPRFLEPSWFNRMVTYAYYPDHVSTFCHAAQSARLALTLADFGHDDLSKVFADSAVKAFDWASTIFLDQTARDTHFAKAREILGEADYGKGMDFAQKQAWVFRLAAAGQLFRLTGENEKYGKLITSAWPFNVAGSIASGLWAYASASHAATDNKVSAAIFQQFVGRAGSFIVKYSEGTIAYRNLQFLGASLFGFGSQGTDGSDVALTLIRAHAVAERTNKVAARKFLEALQAGRQHNDGANQVGLSFMVGQGARWPQRPLHVDSESAAVDPPVGITIYGWVQLFIGSGFVWGNSPINILPDWTPENIDHSFERRVEPYRLAMPIYEFLIEHPMVIASQEYTVQQTIIPAFLSSLYLWGWDGNSETKLP